VFRRFQVALTHHIESGWHDAVPVTMGDVSEAHFKEYEEASKAMQRPIPILLGEYMQSGIEGGIKPFIISRRVSDFADVVALNASKGLKTYGVRLGTLGDDYYGINYVSFRLIEIKQKTGDSEVDWGGDFAALECLIVGDDMWGYRFVVVSVAVR
jgi:hypothetical protein